MAQIPCHGVVIEIDDSDLPVIDGLSLRVRVKSEALRYIEFKLRGRTTLLHRHLLGATVGQFVDHINGNGLDNRRENLRLCTHAENMQNRRIHSNNQSGFKGVYFDVRRGMYRSDVRAFNHRYHVGSFKTAVEAHEAYMAKAQEIHGEFFGEPDPKQSRPEGPCNVKGR